MKDQEQRNLYILWGGCFMVSVSFSLVMPFLPRFIDELNGPENLYIWAGWTYAVTYIASSIMAPIWGNLADRHGRRPMIIRSGITIAVVYLLMSIVTNPYQLFGLRFLNGALSGFIPSSIALIATNTAEHRVGRALALLQTGTATGGILGPILGGTLADLIGIRTTMQVAGIVTFIATALVIFGVRESPLRAEQVRTNPLQDLKLALTSRTLAAILIATVMINLSIQSLEPLLTQFVTVLRQESFIALATQWLFPGDASAFLAGFVFSLPAIAIVLAASRWAGLGEKIGFARLLALGLLTAGILVVPQALVKTIGTLIVLRFLYGIMTAAVQPAINATLSAAVHPSFRGRAFGINQSAQALGSVLGPTLGGYVANGFGPRAVFVWTGALLLLSGWWVQRQLTARTEQFQVGAPRGT